jgi:hypothetical protein
MASADRLTTAWKCILPEVRDIRLLTATGIGLEVQPNRTVVVYTILSIPGYSNVQTALDTLNSGKQDNLTAASTLTIGTLRAGNGTVATVDLVHCEH